MAEKLDHGFTIKEWSKAIGLPENITKAGILYYIELGIFEVCGEWEGETIYQLTEMGITHAKELFPEGLP
jgi:hypothetical protein